MTDINTLMDADERYIHGKIEIVYSDANVDKSITTSSQDTGKDTYSEQIIDGIRSVPYKWFALHDNKLDGTFHFLSEDKTVPVGWWNDSLSDANGVFTSPPSLMLQFDPRHVDSFDLVSDNIANVILVDFTIELYDSVDTLLYTETVINNNLQSWFKPVSPTVINVSKMVLTISKINKPFYTARVVEFFVPVKKFYYDADITSLDILEEVEYVNEGITLGTISANEIDISFDNQDKEFSATDPSSALKSYLKKNRKITVSLGVEDPANNNEIQWHQMGIYWSNSWSIPDNAMIANVTARDILETMRTSSFTTSAVYTNATLYDMFKFILEDFGLTAGDYVLDIALKNIIIPYIWFSRTTHRTALSRLAGCAIVQVYCNRSNQVVVKIPSSTDDVKYIFDDNKNVYEKSFPLSWSDITNYFEVTSTTLQPGNTTSVLSDTSIISIPANDTMVVTYNYNSTPVISIEQPIITADHIGVTIDSYKHYCWGIEVTYKNIALASHNVTSISIQGIPLIESGNAIAVAKDDDLILDDGEIKISVKHDFIQSNEYAQQLANQLLSTYKDSKYNIVIQNRGHIGLQLGDRVAVQDLTQQYGITRQTIKWDGFLEGSTEGKVLATITPLEVPQKEVITPEAPVVTPEQPVITPEQPIIKEQPVSTDMIVGEDTLSPLKGSVSDSVTMYLKTTGDIVSGDDIETYSGTIVDNVTIDALDAEGPVVTDNIMPYTPQISDTLDINNLESSVSISNDNLNSYKTTLEDNVVLTLRTEGN